MKRYSRFYLSVLSLILCLTTFIGTVFAGDWFKTEEINNHKYLPMCAYKTTFTVNFEKRVKKINIMYNLDSKKWLVVYSKDGISDKSEEKSGNADKVFSKKGAPNVHISDDIKKKLINNGECPPNGYFIDDVAFTRVCFGTEKDCKSNIAGGETVKSYDIATTIVNYFKNDINEAQAINNCSKLIEIDESTYSKIQEEKILTDFQKSFLGGHQVPEFIKSSKALEEGKNIIKDNYSILRDDCISEIKNNTSLSNEEKEDLIDEVNTKVDSLIDQVDTAVDKMDTPMQNIDYEEVPREIVCPLGPEVTKDLSGALKIFKILAPLIMIVTSTFEAIKTITKGDAASELKNVAKRFGKRAIYAILMFFLPVIINQIMIIANVWDENGQCDLSNPVSNGISGETNISDACAKYNNKKSECDKYNLCEYEASTNTCVMVGTSFEVNGCPAYNGDENKCNLENKCEWNSSNKKCVDKSTDCSLYNLKPDECPRHGCIYFGNVCYPNEANSGTNQASCNTITSKETCNHNEKCEWDNSINACKNFEYKNPNSSVNNPLVPSETTPEIIIGETPTVKKNCSNYKNKGQECIDNDCFYNWSNNICQERTKQLCEPIVDSNVCNLSNCFYYNGKCNDTPNKVNTSSTSENTCSLYIDKSTCIANGCQFKDKKCITKAQYECSSKKKDACDLLSGCDYVSGKCVANNVGSNDICTTYPTNICTVVKGCILNNDETKCIKEK